MNACPAGIDIRAGLQVECINCAQCIDACSERMERLDKKSLIDYFFGITRGTTQQKWRPRVLWLSFAVAFFAALFVYQVAVRVPVDFRVENESMQGTILETSAHLQGNRYRITIENRSLLPAAYRLSIAGLALAELRTRVNPIMLPADSAKTVIAYLVKGKGFNDGAPVSIWFTIEQVDHPEISITREARFFMPATRGDKR